MLSHKGLRVPITNSSSVKFLVTVCSKLFLSSFSFSTFLAIVKVHLIAMPPYAPDNNPIEHVWNTTKQVVANIQQNTFQETKEAFSDFVAKRQFRYSFASF